MASEVWTFLLSLALLLPALGLAQSGGGGGDDEDGDAEPGHVCFTELTIKFSSLTCQFDDDLVGTLITLCQDGPLNECRNSTLTSPSYTKEITTVASYELIIQGREKIYIKISDMVKLPAPKSIKATYLNNSGVQVGANNYQHEFVKSFQFEVHIWNRTIQKKYDSAYQPFIIEWENLGVLKVGSIYFVKMRVRPALKTFFKGPWSDWSPTTNFTVDKETIGLVQNGKDDALLYYIISAIIAILVLVICLVTRFRRKALKDFILPNVPHPKTTLVHMQKFNKGLLLSFSPEIFSDIHINRLDEVGEGKPLASESTDELEAAGIRSRCPSQLSQVLLWQFPPGDGSDGSDSAGGSQSTLEDDGELEDHGDGLDPSGTGLRLLRGADPTTSDSGHSSGDLSLTSSTSAPQRECKDEAYVTMSSLFKTQ